LQQKKERERYLDQDNRDNSNRRNNQNNGHNKKHAPDNMVATADKNKKFFKNKRPEKPEELESMPCIWHLGSRHTTRECYFFFKRYMRIDNKSNGKEDDQKKEEGDQGDNGFQNPKGTVAVIFSGVLGSRSKHQNKQALRTIMAAEPATPRYLNWSQYLI
jgi:hypothetical protein